MRDENSGRASLFASFRTVLLLLPVVLLGAEIAPARAQILFRSIDGSGNNPFHPSWGTPGESLLRLTTVDYADLIEAPAGANRPGAREVSNAVVAQTGQKPSAAAITDFIWQWGQFIDHDIDLTGSATPSEPFPIPVPQGDAWFDPMGTGTQVIELTRSLHTPNATLLDPRQQINEITAFIDGSMVYGSDDARALALRTLDGTGRLKTSAGDLLPFNTLGLPNAPDSNDPSFFLAGDVRANEQVGLTALHTLFVREHNTLAKRIHERFPYFPDTLVYEIARAIVGAEIQHITYEEWLPLLLGPGALAPYTGWKPQANPGIANSFSTSAFRFGHSMLSSHLQRLDADMQSIPQGALPLQAAFFSPDVLIDEGGIEPLLRGLATQRPQEIDTRVVDDVRNFLFGPPGAGGFDLAALNIQRGRDHGLPGYNQLRQDRGLAPKANFLEVTSDARLQAQLLATYGTPDDMDAWVGILAEDHLPGALVGELASSILVDQFERLRDGDRFYYRNAIRGSLILFVENQTLAKVIWRNTKIGAELPAQVFQQPLP